MDYRYLKAFLLTAKYSSFSRAAEELQIAQSAVSRQIRLLEESIGSQLFLRSPQRVVLTPAGKELLAAASQFDLEIESILGTSPQVIRIGTLPGLMEHWLADEVSVLAMKTKMNFRIVGASVAEILSGMEHGDLDFGFVNDNIQTESITSRKLFDEELFLISRDKIDSAKLEKQCWVYMSTARHLREVASQPGLRWIQVNSMATLLRFVELGAGIAIVPGHIVAGNDRVRKQKLKDIANDAIYLATIDYKIWPKHFREFYDHFVD